MKIGFPNHPRRNIISEIQWIGESGFDFVDLYLEPDRAGLEFVDPAAIREALHQYDLDATGHLAWYLPIGSPMPQLRRAAVACAADYLAVFALTPVEAVTVHANWPSGLFSVEEGLRWQAESLREIRRIGAEMNLSVMYEPVDRPLDTADNIERILDDSPGVLLHLDVGHANLHGRKPVEMICRLGRRLHHVHLNDNDGRSDQHLPAGCGNIDWKAVFRTLREVSYDGTLTLEVFSRDRDYVRLCKEKVETLLRQTYGTNYQE